MVITVWAKRNVVKRYLVFTTASENPMKLVMVYLTIYKTEASGSP
jgi:hypothetical protein